MISATVEPPWLDSRLVRTFVRMSLAGPGATRREVVEQRLRGGRADHAQDRHQRQQHREQREHAEVGQRRRPGRELVLAELLEGALQDRRKGFLGKVGGLVWDVAFVLARRAGCGMGHRPEIPRSATPLRPGRKFPDRSALWTPSTAQCGRSERSITCGADAASHEDRRHHRARVPRSRGARPHGRGRDGRRPAELLPRQRGRARGNRAPRPRRRRSRRPPGRDPAGPPGPEAADRQAARRRRRVQAGRRDDVRVRQQRR